MERNCKLGIIVSRWIGSTLIRLGATVLLLVAALAGESLRAGEPAIKVMSFNIRYGAANDGDNSWKHRDGLVIETIKMFGPDLLGAQEVLAFQADFLKENLPGYGFHGVGRDDGAAEGEYVPVMYRLDRFELLDSGHFWLSESPDEPGSMSWDTSLTRMCSWVILRDKKGSDRPFAFANTHFDHRGREARRESAKLIRERALSIEEEIPVIIVGDFNNGEDDAPYAALVKGEGVGGPAFVDSFRAIYPKRSDQEGTMSRWTGNREGRRIDWIIHSPKFVTLYGAINHTNEDGRYPSDHYPVQAILRRR